MINLIHGECLAEMDKLIANGVKVDAIITDPPYNLKLESWDDINNYELFIETFYNKCKQLTFNIVIFFDYKYTKLFETIDIPFERFIWHREGGFRGKTIKKGYEPFYWYGDGKSYNRITEINLYAKTDKRLKPEKTISNVWNIPNLVGKKLESVGHPTQKPLKLMDRIVRMTTQPNNIILDPFMGSGTTGVACKNTNRNFIGIELDENYYNIATKRIETML